MPGLFYPPVMFFGWQSGSICPFFDQIGAQKGRAPAGRLTYYNVYVGNTDQTTKNPNGIVYYLSRIIVEM